MTNKSSSKQHGLHNVKAMQPKSKLRKRRNKAKAKIRREERQAALQQESKETSQKPQQATE